MVVAAGSMYSEPFKIIKHLIDDNKVILSGSYPTFPDKSPVYPLCTIEVTTDPAGKSFGNQSRGLIYTVEIGCNSKSRKQTDEIFDELDYILSKNTVSLGKSGLKWIDTASSPNTPDIINDEKIHNKIMVSTYKWYGDI